MIQKLISLTMIILTLASCSPKQKNPEKWTDEDVNTWFEKQEWLNRWHAQPDESIDRRELAIYYHKNPRHWDQAFKFLKSADLKNLPIGTQELEGKHLFIAVSEYDSKDKADTRYESHRKYIDIQYAIKGEELIGITTLDKVKVEEPYNEEKDIAFYAFDGGDYRKATPEKFLIFFPEDVHRPSIKVNENVPVKKAVVKILIEE